jgi:hypothetical protein
VTIVNGFESRLPLHLFQQLAGNSDIGIVVLNAVIAVMCVRSL